VKLHKVNFAGTVRAQQFLPISNLTGGRDVKEVSMKQVSHFACIASQHCALESRVGGDNSLGIEQAGGATVAC
jgi:hypothetical protein